MTNLKGETVLALARLARTRQSHGRVPGLVAGVVREGRLTWSEGVGSADLDRPGEPPTADSQFLVASISKTFTAVATMMLRDEGKLSLDDPLGRHLPVAEHGGVTVRQMLSHVTGMQREPVGDVWQTLAMPERGDLLSGWDQAERILRPHHRWHYSNLVYSMLGEVIERLDERPWFDSVRTRILEPLGLGRTTLGLGSGAVTGYYVPPFSDVPVREPVLVMGAMAAAGGLATTPTDLAAWAAFLADPDETVLSQATIEEMCQPQTMADLEDWQLAWGLGLMLVRRDGRVFVGHTGGLPGHLTGLFVHRETRTGGVVMMNSTSAPDPAEIAVSLATQVLDNDPLPPEVWTPGEQVPAELEGVLGRWFSEGAGFTFSVRRGRLEARMDGAPAHQRPSVFVPIHQDVYRTESGRETGELLRITRDSGGAVTKMSWATYLVTREPYAFGEWL